MKSVDRISQLPDELVCHILSFLPTVRSFQTTFLSRRWKNLQTSVNTTDMNYERDFRDRYLRDSTIFPKIIEAVLSLHDLSIIQKFRLSSSWSGISDDLPTSCCFSSLKILCLYSGIQKPRDIEKLISDCCPVLEELDISGAVRDVVSNFSISTPKLKRLTMNFIPISFPSHVVVINAPKLEFLYMKGWRIHYTLERPKFLDKAVIDISRVKFNTDATDLGYARTIMTKVTKLLAGEQDLSIKAALFIGTCNLPTALNTLRKLELILYDNSYREYVTKFLNWSPNIEYLALELHNRYLRKEQSFIPPGFVPVCLPSHLKAISMRGFIGRSSELELIRYLLQYGEVLNELIISCHPTLDCGNEESLYKEILSFPRASRTCKVIFIKASSSSFMLKF